MRCSSYATLLEETPRGGSFACGLLLGRSGADRGNAFRQLQRFVHVAFGRVLQGGNTCSKDLDKIAGLLRRYEASGYLKCTWYDRHTIPCRRRRDRWSRWLGLC